MTLAKRFAIIAVSDEKITGFADLEADGHIDRFFVHADCQGRGVGAALMRAIFKEAERLSIQRLFAEVSITARPFFERFGFEILSEQQVTLRDISLTN